MPDPAPRILLVDDDPDVPESIAQLLEATLPAELPREVLVARNAVDALGVADDAATQRAPLLVVSDFSMGGALDGLQLLEEIGHIKPDARLVLLSGHHHDELSARPEFSQVHLFLQKPFEVEALRALAHGFLEGAKLQAAR